MADIFKINTNNSIYHNVAMIKTSLTGAAIANYNPKTVDITRIENKYTGRFHFDIPPRASG